MGVTKAARLFFGVILADDTDTSKLQDLEDAGMLPMATGRRDYPSRIARKWAGNDGDIDFLCVDETFQERSLGQIDEIHLFRDKFESYWMSWAQDLREFCERHELEICEGPGWFMLAAYNL